MRTVAKPYFRRKYKLTIHHEDRFPRTGPVLIAPNTSEPARRAAARGDRAPDAAPARQDRGVRRAPGQDPPADRADPGRPSAYDVLAVRQSIKVLRDGRVLNIYPEGTRGPGDFSRIRTRRGVSAHGDGRADPAGGAARDPAAARRRRGIPTGRAAGSMWSMASRSRWSAYPFPGGIPTYARLPTRSATCCERISEGGRSEAHRHHPLPGAPDKEDPDD